MEASGGAADEVKADVVAGELRCNRITTWCFRADFYAFQKKPLKQKLSATKIQIGESKQYAYLSKLTEMGSSASSERTKSSVFVSLSLL